MKKRKSLWFGAGGSMVIDDTFLKYKHPYGRTFRVPLKDITTITVDEKGWGYGYLKVIGNGTELAKAKMPLTWANTFQEWILRNLPSNG